MSTDVANDAILQPYLMAQDSKESQRQLMILLSEHAEARMRGIIISRMRSYLNGQEHSAEVDDVYSEAKTRLLTYLYDLKTGNRKAPCGDFTGYVAAIAHNACHDHFRKTHPTGYRLHKKIRDLVRAHPSFAMWKSQDNKKGEWLCGFRRWMDRTSTSISTAWLHRFYEHPETVTEGLAAGDDIQWLEIDDLLAAIFNDVGEPIGLNDVVNVVSDIRGVKDAPVVSFDVNGTSLSLRLTDSELRIDSLLEMREVLARFWQGLCELPRDQFIAYLLHARDDSGEDLINLLLGAEITTESELASLLALTLDEVVDLRLNRLPLDNEEISRELHVTVERVYKLRYRAGKYLNSLLAEIIPQKRWRM
jgi:DNA-directed RNA polymerase specialized sigma24 family protein